MASVHGSAGACAAVLNDAEGILSVKVFQSGEFGGGVFLPGYFVCDTGADQSRLCRYSGHAAWWVIYCVCAAVIGGGV